MKLVAAAMSGWAVLSFVMAVVVGRFLRWRRLALSRRL
jgi:hypothetical protein